MNLINRTSIAALLCATLVSESILAQDPAAELARAVVIEAQEGDLAAAEKAYHALLASENETVRAEAALRLGALLWRLDRKDEGKPFLEQAVAAGGKIGEQATAVLEGQDEASRQEQERLAKARAIIQLASQRPNTFQDGFRRSLFVGTEADACRERLWQLHTLGEAGAEALIQYVENEKLSTKPQCYQRDELARYLVMVLWALDTTGSRDYLLSVQTSAPVEWRRFLAELADNGIAPTLIPVALSFLQDPDPTGEVARLMAGSLPQLAIEDLIVLTSDTSPVARSVAFEQLRARWKQFSNEDRLRVFAAIEAPLRASLDGKGLARAAAWGFLCRSIEHGPDDFRLLFLESLGRCPPELLSFNYSAAKRFRCGDHGIAAMLAASRELSARVGAHAAYDRLARTALSSIYLSHEPQWSATALEGILELLEQGYAGATTKSPTWSEHFFALASDEEVVRLLRNLARIARPHEIFARLAQRQLPAGSFAALQHTLERCLRAMPDHWPGEDTSKGRRSAGYGISQLLSAIGRTRAPEAAPWLVELIEREPYLIGEATYALIMITGATDTEATRSALRTMLVHEGAPGYPLPPRIRVEAFARLARLGDEPSIALFSRAYELGLAGVSVDVATSGAAAGLPVTTYSPRTVNTGGIGLLGDLEARDKSRQPWHAYSDDQLRRAWHALLTGPARDRVLADLPTVNRVPPVAVLPVLTDLLPELLRSEPGLANDNRLELLTRVFTQVCNEQLAADPALRAGIARLLTTDEVKLASNVFGKLPVDVAAEFADEAHALFARHLAPGGLVRHFHRAGLALSTEEWRRVFDSGWAPQTLARLPETLAPELRMLVESIIRSNPDVVSRSRACTALADRCGTAAVPALLEALRDPEDKVRQAATAALERIRFHAEQTAWWQNQQAGIDTSQASAAAKLIALAQPGQDLQQRLLAIRSLGVLAAPESLPYLIGWTKDEDAAIQQAARAAIGAIHGRVEPAKK